jgi:hypothetical protein
MLWFFLDLSRNPPLPSLPRSPSVAKRPSRPNSRRVAPRRPATRIAGFVFWSRAGLAVGAYPRGGLTAPEGPRRELPVLDSALAEKRGTFPGCKALKSHEMGLDSRGMRGGDGGVKFRRFGGHTGSCRHQSRRTLRRTPWWAMQGSNLRPHPCEGCALPLS